MTDTQRPCRGLAAVSVGALLVVLSGCDVLGQAGGAIASAEKEAAADSITVVNEASEPIQVFLVEEGFAFRGFWIHPSSDDLPVLNTGESVKHALDDILQYKRGRSLYVAISLEKTFENGKTKFSPDGPITRSWEELQEASFRVEIRDEDLPEREDRQK